MDGLRVGVIGLRGHARRHIELFQHNADVVLERVYYHRSPPAGFDDLPITGRLEDCLDLDALVISSPTNAHVDHIRALREYPGYILLEKPAATKQDDISALLDLSDDTKTRIRVNFNFEFHDVARHFARFATSSEIGDAFAFDVHSSHGGVFRSDWTDSWRVSSPGGLGPIETVGIHFVRFAEGLFGRSRHASIWTRPVGNALGAADTGEIWFQTEKDVRARIRCSYAAPYGIRMALWGTNGYLEYDGTKAKLRSPRDTYDEEGFFAEPPVAECRAIDYEKGWQVSLERAQRRFLETARNRRRLDPADFDRDVSVMTTLLGARPER